MKITVQYRNVSVGDFELVLSALEAFKANFEADTPENVIMRARITVETKMIHEQLEDIL